MSADFPLITDLPKADQIEIARIQAIDSDNRTESEAAFLDARGEYITNEELPSRIRKGQRSPNSSPATSHINFSDEVADGEVVVIGADTYEFDDDEDVEEGNILVDISGDASPEAAAAALATAIGEEGTEEVEAVVTNGDNLTVTSNGYGKEFNEIAVSTTCENASWGGNVSLVDGNDVILANEGEIYIYDNDTIYFAPRNITNNDDLWIPLITEIPDAEAVGTDGIEDEAVTLAKLNSNALPKSGIINPLGEVTPDYIGQIYIDTATDAAYIAAGLTSSDWTSVQQVIE